MATLPVTMPSRPPSLGLLGPEPIRAMFEYARLRLMNTKPLPRGDGQPVVIFPGLASGRHGLASAGADSDRRQVGAAMTEKVLVAISRG